MFGWGTIAKLIAVLAAVIVLGGMVYFSYRFVENLQNENSLLSQDLATERAARQVAVANWQAAQATVDGWKRQAQLDREAFNTILGSTVAAQNERGRLIQEINRVPVPSQADIASVNALSRHIDCLLAEASGSGRCPDPAPAAGASDTLAAPGTSQVGTP